MVAGPSGQYSCNTIVGRRYQADPVPGLGLLGLAVKSGTDNRWLPGAPGCTPLPSVQAPLFGTLRRNPETSRLTTDNESDKAVSMSGFKEPSFADRQKAAQQARQDILNKFRSQPGLDDPVVAQRRAEREAQAAERAKAKLAREAARAEEKRREAEAAAAAAAQLAREKEEAAAREIAIEAERKAARDARYAARKKRK